MPDASTNDLTIPVVDFTDVQTKSFDPIPRGEYVVEVDEADIRDGTKYPYLNLMYTVLEGEFAGRKLFDICSFSPKALWKLKGLYEAMGLSEEELAGEVEVDIDEFPGVVLYATVTIGKDREGQPRNQIRSYDIFADEDEAVAAFPVGDVQPVPPVVSADETPAPTSI